MGKDSTIAIMFLVAILIVTVMFLGDYAPSLGISSSLTDMFIQVIPGVFITLLGLVGASKARGASIVGSFMAIGVGLALLLGEMNTAGILTEWILSGVTLIQVQGIVIIFTIIFGGAIYASSSR